MIVGIALTVTSGHLIRNTRLFGHPLSTETEKYKVEEPTLSSLSLNMLRHTLMHLGVPEQSYNYRHTKFWRRVLGEHASDPATTWGNRQFYVGYRVHEDVSGNLLHTLVLVAACVVIPVL